MGGPAPAPERRTRSEPPTLALSASAALPAIQQRSLFGEILDWMLAPLLLLWPMSLGLTWVVAQTIANRPYDRELAELVRALAKQAAAQVQVQVQVQAPAAANAPALRPEPMRSALERTAAALTHDDDEDRTYWQVLGRRGELLAGAAGLAVPSEELALLADVNVRFRDDLIGDEPVRVAYLWLAGVGERSASAAGNSGGGSRDANEGLVQVAQTLGKRSHLATEIIKGVILPQFVILPLAVVLVWFALARGIRPLAELQQRIRRRESTDLSPIAEGNVPDEVAPLVRAINDLLQRLDRSIAAQRHFLADAAHQLKTPLAGLRMQAELAAREIDSGRGDAAAMRHALQQIARSTERAAHTVNQLLSMARADDDGQAERHQRVDLAALTREVVQDFVPRAFERGIDLGYEGPGTGTAAATWLVGEPVLLGEMVRNLVDNALHYTPGGGTVTARLHVRPDALVLEVEDNGPGIAAAEREAVFRPFYRALGTTVDGSGLGLAIVAEVAQRHAARVQVDDARARSEAGNRPGARFTVRFARPGAP